MIERIEIRLNRHRELIDDLALWHAEVRGMVSLLRIVFGASVISTIVSVLAIARSLSS